MDLVDALADLNIQLNGDPPSETMTKTDAIPRDIAYAVAEVIRQLRGEVPDEDAPSVVAFGSREALIVETAWSAVLAGDIDDLREHLDEEGVS